MKAPNYLKIIIGVSFLLLVEEVGYGQDLEAIGQKKPLTLTGTISANAMFFNAEGRPASREKFTWYFTGNPILELYGVTLPFSFTVSEQQRDFRQPFNQFGVSPYYKWAKGHFGYRNIVFSPFTLGGHTIAGAGLELTPGKLRFGFMYGRLFRAVQAIGNPDGTFVQTPTFKRNAFSTKIGYGTENNFVDLIMLKGHDDENSINYTTTEAEITPAENLVVGIYSRQQFLEKFRFELELAQSLYTSNINTVQPDTIDEGILIKPFSSMVNHKNSSTTYSSALETSLGYEQEQLGLRVKFRKVDPNYQSMGSYFFQNDLRNITLEPHAKFFNSALQVSGSYGYQTDNLDGARESTTKRKIGSLNVSGRLGEKYTGNIFYSNYDIGQAAGKIALDTLVRISQTVKSWGMLHNLMWSGDELTHTFMINYNNQTLTDRNPTTALYTNYNMDTWLASYYATFNAAKISISGSYTTTQFELPSQQTKIKGPTLGITKMMVNNTMSVNLMWSSMAYTINDVKSRNINRISVNSSYRVSRKHRFNIRFYINKSTKETDTVMPFKETKGDIGYAYTF